MVDEKKDGKRAFVGGYNPDRIRDLTRGDTVSKPETYNPTNMSNLANRTAKPKGADGQSSNSQS